MLRKIKSFIARYRGYAILSSVLTLIFLCYILRKMYIGSPKNTKNENKLKKREFNKVYKGCQFMEQYGALLEQENSSE